MSEGVTRKSGGLPLPPLIYLSAIAIGIILDAVYPLAWFSQPMSDILVAAGLVALFAVAALLFTAIASMRRAKTTLNPNAVADHLITNGPFAVTRNPMYLANTLLLMGIGMIFGSTWFLLLAIVAAFATQKLAIEREEKMLMEKFGKKYRDYAKRVRRWI